MVISRAQFSYNFDFLTLVLKNLEKYVQISWFLVDFRGLGWDASFSHVDFLGLLLLTDMGLMGLILRLAKQDFTISRKNWKFWHTVH